MGAVFGSVGWKGAFWIGVIAVSIAAVVWFQAATSSAPTLATAHVYGTMESAFVPHTDRGGAATRITVRLDDNRNVALNLPTQHSFRPGARVKLAIHEKESDGVRWLDYEFIGYEQPIS